MRSSPDEMAQELRYLQTFLDALAEGLDMRRADSGIVFLASSAGGIYGRGSSRTITEANVDEPTTAYAVGKLAQEDRLRAFHDATGVRCVVGRISNVYGSAQNVAKGQGLITHVCRAALLRRPMIVTVPLDTRRDYVHTSDASRRAIRWVELAASRPTAFATKLIVSGRSATVGDILSVVRRVSRHRPPVVFARGSTPDLPRTQTFRSTQDPDVDAATPARLLEVGITEIWNATLQDFVRGAAGQRLNHLRNHRP